MQIAAHVSLFKQKVELEINVSGKLYHKLNALSNKTLLQTAKFVTLLHNLT